MIRNLFFIVIVLSHIWANFPSAIGKNGVVTSSSSHATQIGIDVLKDGGNAIDAAIAVGFALGVTFPNAGNIGGGGFMVIRMADGQVTTIDFRETAPLRSHRDMYLDANGDVIEGMSLYSSKAAGVPGTVAGFGYAHEKYGSKSWTYLLRPSVKLAMSGFYLSYRDAMYLNMNQEFLSRDEESAKIFTAKDRYEVGDLFLQKRSMVKDENPGLWDTAAAGHVGAGENYLHSAQRELKEELGLNVSIKEVMRIPAQLNTLWEHVRVYECVTNHQIKINGLEISEGRYWTLPELTQSIESNPKIFTSTFHLIFNAYINIDK